MIEVSLQSITTSRLCIREFSESDAEFILKLLNEKEFIHYIGDKKVRDIPQAIEYLNSGPIKSYHTHGYGLGAICLKESNKAIGMCGLLKRDSDPEIFDEVEIGYALFKEYCGNGYAIEAVEAVLKQAQNEFQLTQIAAITSSDNERSQKLLRKAGFTFYNKIKIFKDESIVDVFMFDSTTIWAEQ